MSSSQQTPSRRSEAGPSTALVIGGGRGIGAATALELARRGYDVDVVARTIDEAEAVAEAIRALGRRGAAFRADICSEDDVRALFAGRSRFGGLVSVLVNSAGDAILGGLSTTTPEAFAEMLQINLIAVYRVIYHARPFFDPGQSQIINVISRAGRRPYGNALAYGSAKAALVYLTRALADDLASTGVRVNGVSPGAVATAMRRKVVPNEDPTTLMTPDSVAALIGLLTEQASVPLNGAVIDCPW